VVTARRGVVANDGEDGAPRPSVSAQGATNQRAEAVGLDAVVLGEDLDRARLRRPTHISDYGLQGAAHGRGGCWRDEEQPQMAAAACAALDQSRDAALGQPTLEAAATVFAILGVEVDTGPSGTAIVVRAVEADGHEAAQVSAQDVINQGGGHAHPAAAVVPLTTKDVVAVDEASAVRGQVGLGNASHWLEHDVPPLQMDD